MTFVPCNIHIRTDASATDIANVLSPIIKKHAEVSPPHNKWVTILDEAAVGEPADEVQRVARELSTAHKIVRLLDLVPR